MKKIYRVMYHNKKIDLIEAKDENEAVKMIRKKINFSAVDDKLDKEQRKQFWLTYHKCLKCNYSCTHHISKNNHSYWICSCCDRTYDDEGKFKFKWDGY